MEKHRGITILVVGKGNDLDAIRIARIITNQENGPIMIIPSHESIQEAKDIIDREISNHYNHKLIKNIKFTPIPKKSTKELDKKFYHYYQNKRKGRK